jgi:choline dehydrogenase-like flavoprotein
LAGATPMSRSFEDVVIGSGPSGYAAALALSRAGRSPAVVDFGRSPRFDAAEIVKSSSIAMKGEESRQRVFQYPRTFVVSRDGAHLPLSSARGGLSRIWGAGILVRSEHDMPGLAPIYPDLRRAYDELLEHLPLTGAVDRTSLRFPWPNSTTPAPQSARYSRLVAGAQSMDSGVLVGYPRISVDAPACVRCGQCLHGCPLDLFFSSGTAIARLEAGGGCTTVEGPVITLRQAGAGRVCLVLPSGELVADRVYVAAGPIATPALLQRSALAPSSIVVRDSAVFYAGFVNTASTAGDEAVYTASQAVAYSERSGADDFQLSLYDSNPEYLERLAGVSPLAAGLLRGIGLSRLVDEKVNAGIGFLDSSVSGSLRLDHRNGRTWVTRQPARGLWRRAFSVTRRVNRVTSHHGLHAIPGAVLVPAVGSGYHSGAGLPMGGSHVDLGGRLRGSGSIFVVDATSLPRIWAGSHTFTAMANAFRIAASQP